MVWLRLPTYQYIHTRIHSCIYTNPFTYLPINMYLCIYTYYIYIYYIYTYENAYLYTHAHNNIHTHTHIYTYIYISYLTLRFFFWFLSNSNNMLTILSWMHLPKDILKWIVDFINLNFKFSVKFSTFVVDCVAEWWICLLVI